MLKRSLKFDVVCTKHTRGSHLVHKSSCDRWPRHGNVITSACAYHSPRSPAGAVARRHHAAALGTLGPQQTSAPACKFPGRHVRRTPARHPHTQATPRAAVLPLLKQYPPLPPAGASSDCLITSPRRCSKRSHPGAQHSLLNFLTPPWQHAPQGTVARTRPPRPLNCRSFIRAPHGYRRSLIARRSGSWSM